MPPILGFVAVGMAPELVAVPMSMLMEVDMPDISIGSDEDRRYQLVACLGSQEVKQES